MRRDDLKGRYKNVIDNKRALRELLLDVFNIPELLDFVRNSVNSNDWDQYISASSAPPAILVGEIIESLNRRKLLDQYFFAQLLELRPKSKTKIQQVAEQWSSESDDNAPTPEEGLTETQGQTKITITDYTGTVWAEAGLTQECDAVWEVLKHSGCRPIKSVSPQSPMDAFRRCVLVVLLCQVPEFIAGVKIPQDVVDAIREVQKRKRQYIVLVRKGSSGASLEYLQAIRELQGETEQKAILFQDIDDIRIKLDELIKEIKPKLYRSRKPSSPTPRKNSLTSVLLSLFKNPENMESHSLISDFLSYMPASDEIKTLRSQPFFYFSTLVKHLWRTDTLMSFFQVLDKALVEDPALEDVVDIEEWKDLKERYELACSPHSGGSEPVFQRGYLDRIILLPEFGLLLRASEVNPDASCFLTGSGRKQEEFLTIWELFDEPDELSLFITGLADFVQSLMKRESFSSLVTATSTGRHLVEFIHSRIDKSARSRSVQDTFDDDDAQHMSDKEHALGVHFLTPEMTLDARTERTPRLQNQRVLIITDVIASRALMDRMVTAVQRFGGEVIGVVAATYVGSDDKRGGGPELALMNAPPTITRSWSQGAMKQSAEDKLRVVHFESPVTGVKVYAMSRHYIRSVVGHHGSCVMVDPCSVLPVTQETLLVESNPMFSDLSETISRLDEEKALSFGLYRSHGRIVTGALSFSKVLCEDDPGTPSLGGVVGASVDGFVKDNFTVSRDAIRVVTTHRQEDIEFANFVQHRLSLPAAQRLHLPRREGTRTPNPFVLMLPKVKHLEGHQVLLLLSAADTSEHLRAIVSLLTSAGATFVGIVCLVSRMRYFSTNFLTRVHSLSGRLHVRFATVFELPEVEHVVLHRMTKTLEDVLDRYDNTSAPPALVRLAASEFKHFRPKQLFSRTLEDKRIRPLRELGGVTRTVKLGETGPTAKAQTVDGFLFAQTRILTPLRKTNGATMLVGDRGSPAPLIDTLTNNSLSFTKAELYQLFAVLLSDLSYLTAQPGVQKDTNGLYDVRSGLRQAFIDACAQNNKVRAGNLLFLIATLGSIDITDTPLSSDPYAEVCARAISVFRKELANPTLNLEYWLINDARVTVALSMLIHLRFAPRGRCPNPEALSKCRADLGEFRRELGRYIQSNHHWRVPVARSRVDTLLYELGEFREATRARVIRHLRAHLFRRPETLSYETSITLAVNDLTERFPTTENPSPSEDGRYLTLKPSDEKYVKRVLEGAQLACAHIERLARSAQALITFGGYVLEEYSSLSDYLDPSSRRYSEAGEAERSNLLASLEELSSLLDILRMRRRTVASQIELTRLKELTRTVYRLLWLRDAGVRVVLSKYDGSVEREVCVEMPNVSHLPPGARAVEVPPNLIVHLDSGTLEAVIRLTAKSIQRQTERWACLLGIREPIAFRSPGGARTGLLIGSPGALEFFADSQRPPATNASADELLQSALEMLEAKQGSIQVWNWSGETLVEISIICSLDEEGEGKPYGTPVSVITDQIPTLPGRGTALPVPNELLFLCDTFEMEDIIEVIVDFLEQAPCPQGFPLKENICLLGMYVYPADPVQAVAGGKSRPSPGSCLEDADWVTLIIGPPGGLLDFNPTELISVPAASEVDPEGSLEELRLHAQHLRTYEAGIEIRDPSRGRVPLVGLTVRRWKRDVSATYPSPDELPQAVRDSLGRFWPQDGDPILYQEGEVYSLSHREDSPVLAEVNKDGVILYAAEG